MQRQRQSSKLFAGCVAAACVAVACLGGAAVGTGEVPGAAALTDHSADATMLLNNKPATARQVRDAQRRNGGFASFHSSYETQCYNQIVVFTDPDAEAAYLADRQDDLDRAWELERRILAAASAGKRVQMTVADSEVLERMCRTLYPDSRK